MYPWCLVTGPSSLVGWSFVVHLAGWSRFHDCMCNKLLHELGRVVNEKCSELAQSPRIWLVVMSSLSESTLCTITS